MNYIAAAQADIFQHPLVHLVQLGDAAFLKRTAAGRGEI